MRSRLCCCLSLALTGCLPASEWTAAPESPQPVAERSEAHAPLARTGNAWADCYRRFQPSAEPGLDLARLAESCAVPAGLRPVTPVHAGAQREGDAPERFAFRVRRGRCYRAFAVGGAGVSDLDLAVYDAGGELVTGDVSRDRWPVVPPRGPLCAEREELYTIAVGVTRGSGAYLLQIWGTDGSRSEP